MDQRLFEKIEVECDKDSVKIMPYGREYVLSSSPFYPKEKQPCAEVYSEHGRGLFLVRSVCEERVFVDEDGIRVLIKISK